MAELNTWLHSLILGRRVSAGTKAILAILESDPAAASYLSAQKLAERAGVNVATVVRAAQFLGFAGWPALKMELRHRYLATMTSEALLHAHASKAEGATKSTFANDIANLESLRAIIDEAQIMRVAAIVLSAQKTMVVATGSYAAPGFQLAHVGQMMGHDIELHTASGTGLVNRIRLLREGDCFFSCNLWRSSKFVLHVAQVAQERGAHIISLTDRRTALTDLADEAIIVPSEGVSFVPSITAAVSTVQALLAEMAAADPERTTASLREVEGMWKTLDLVDPV